MLGLTALSHPPIPPIPPRPTSTPRPLPINLSSSSLLKTRTRIPIRPERFVLLASNNNGLNPDSKGREEVKEREQEGIGSDSDDDLRKNQGPVFGNIRWGDLLLDPDPNNILAVGLTGLLTWASVQVLWQLVIIALAILVAAVKYSFIAAVLLFILITLL